MRGAEAGRWGAPRQEADHRQGEDEEGRESSVGSEKFVIGEGFGGRTCGSREKTRPERLADPATLRLNRQTRKMWSATEGSRGEDAEQNEWGAVKEGN